MRLPLCFQLAPALYRVQSRARRPRDREWREGFAGHATSFRFLLARLRLFCKPAPSLLPSGHVISGLTFVGRKPRMRIRQKPSLRLHRDNKYSTWSTTFGGGQIYFFLNCVHSWKVRATQRFYFLFIFPHSATLHSCPKPNFSHPPLTYL